MKQLLEGVAEKISIPQTCCVKLCTTTMLPKSFTDFSKKSTTLFSIGDQQWKSGVSFLDVSISDDFEFKNTNFATYIVYNIYSVCNLCTKLSIFHFSEKILID